MVHGKGPWDKLDPNAILSGGMQYPIDIVASLQKGRKWHVAKQIFGEQQGDRVQESFAPRATVARKQVFAERLVRLPPRPNELIAAGTSKELRADDGVPKS
jgi:hypothetical protein